jgi:outer membrane protein OmpA-like peptidoglycan-associated protein
LSNNYFENDMRLTTTRFILSAVLLLPTAPIVLAQQPERQVSRTTQRQDYTQPVSPAWNIKTNLLYDATATFNLGLEFRTGERTSIDVPVNYNPWTLRDNRKWKHILVQPEFRLWTRETFDGHFFGLHGHYAFYNAGNLPKPFSQYMRDHRFEGWLAGAGLSYGYRWNFNHRWAMEATVGAGYAYMEYDKYCALRCGDKLGSETKHYFGPTKVGLNLILNFGKSKARPAPAVAAALPPVVVPYLPPEESPAEPPVVIYQPTLRASFITPEVEAVKTRNESGSAFLDFAAGRSAVDPSFRNNAAELRMMDDMIRRIVANPDATITGITITGFASPDGPYVTNMTLSEQRARSLKDYIRSRFDFPESLFTVRGAGEDWTTLEKMVEQSDMAYRDQVLAIIRGTGVFDGRERQLMDLAGGVPYRWMLTEMFPQLRRVEYRVEYDVRPISLEQGREVFGTRPGNLSLNEMFLIANTYAPGSAEFNEVFETAARLFPDSDVANLNAAASALSRNDAVHAARYLGRIVSHDSAYWNNMGMLLWLQGDVQSAATAFERAGESGAANAGMSGAANSGEQGSANAAELQKHLKSLEK